MDDWVMVQAIQEESDIIKHPPWPHAHVAWIPLSLDPSKCGRSLEHQDQVARTIAVAACQGTKLASASMLWNKPWVMSLPLGPNDVGGDPDAVEER